MSPPRVAFKTSKKKDRPGPPLRRTCHWHAHARVARLPARPPAAAQRAASQGRCHRAAATCAEDAGEYLNHVAGCNRP